MKKVGSFRYSNLVWKSDKHKRMARPDVEMVRIKEKNGSAVCILACRNFEFNVLVRDVFLMVIHSGDLCVISHGGRNI